MAVAQWAGNLKYLKTKNVRNIKDPSLNIFFNNFLNVAGYVYTI